MIQGRPIRFLVTTLGGWTVLRIVMLMPTPTNVLLPTKAVLAQATTALPFAGSDWMFPRRGGAPYAPWRRSAPAAVERGPVAGGSAGSLPARRVVDRGWAAGTGALGGGWSSAVADSLLSAQIAFAHDARPPLALASYAPGVGLSPGEAGAPVADSGSGRVDSRWSGAAWMLWRQDDPGRTRLGGAQAGVRIDYALSAQSALRPTLYGRASSALHGVAGAEVAMGVAVDPQLPFPAVVAVERRQALSPGGRNDFAILVAGGVNPVSVGRGFRLDGYGQAGIVGLGQRDAFIDGRLTLERPIGRNRDDDRAGPAIGAAIWGGAQPGAARFDIGPQASMRVRLGHASMRLGAEWRAQVAGNAAPSSGPAFTIGADF
ncbi:MAG: hypothetical protein ABW048_08395 [Sphingobium sp.]